MRESSPNKPEVLLREGSPNQLLVLLTPSALTQAKAQGTRHLEVYPGLNDVMASHAYPAGTSLLLRAPEEVDEPQVELSENSNAEKLDSTPKNPHFNDKGAAFYTPDHFGAVEPTPVSASELTEGQKVVEVTIPDWSVPSADITRHIVNTLQQPAIKKWRRNHHIGLGTSVAAIALANVSNGALPLPDSPAKAYVAIGASVVGALGLVAGSTGLALTKRRFRKDAENYAHIPTIAPNGEPLPDPDVTFANVTFRQPCEEVPTEGADGEPEATPPSESEPTEEATTTAGTELSDNLPEATDGQNTPSQAPAIRSFSPDGDPNSTLAFRLGIGDHLYRRTHQGKHHKPKEPSRLAQRLGRFLGRKPTLGTAATSHEELTASES